MGDPLIALRDLQKVAAQDTVIDIAELGVAGGEVVALVGPAGSSRDMLLQLLLGRTRPTAGTVRLAGLDPAAQHDECATQAGVLFSDDNLYARQSARANLVFHCRLHGLPRARAEEVLVEVGLADHAGVDAERLSPGLARRLAFGRAILHDPQVLLLVDPFARCDDASIALLSRLIRQKADAGAAVLALCESEKHLTALSDRVYQLEQGRLVEAESPIQQQAELPFKIPVRLEGKIVLLNPSDILYAFTESGTTILETNSGRLPSQFSLTELEERLSRSGFFRAHRAYLVNLQHVKEVIPYTRNSFSLKLDDAAGTMIPLSKSAAGELSRLLGY